MAINAPIAETSVPKENNNFYIISWGPGEWTENRTDGVITSIDVKIKGWLKNDSPTGTWRNDPPEDTEAPLLVGQTGTFEETFRWSVPDHLQTTETWGAAEENSNDDEYSEKSLQWMKEIRLTQNYIDAVESVRLQLEAL